MGDGGRESHESGRGCRRARRGARLVAAKLVAVGLALPLLLLAACDGGTGPDDDGSDPPDRVSFEFDFRDSGHDFEGDFTDVPVEQANGVGFDAGHRPLPNPLSGSGLYQAGLNLSDDLFMFFRKRVEGLEPGRSYAVGFELEIASPIHEGCEVGTGTLVVVKAGGAWLFFGTESAFEVPHELFFTRFGAEFSLR